MKWTVEIEEQAEILMKKEFSRGLLSREDIKILKAWIRQVEEKGPESLKETPKWDDHSLQREWTGYRSSMFSYRGRIIYRVEKQKIVVKVVKVTTQHDYRKL